MSEHTITKRKVVSAPVVKRGLPRAGGATTKLVHTPPNTRPNPKTKPGRAGKAAPKTPAPVKTAATKPALVRRTAAAALTPAPTPAPIEVLKTPVIVVIQGALMKYALIDLAGDMDRAELAAYAAAQQRQLREHYAPANDGIGITDEVRVVDAGATAAADEVPMFLHKEFPTDGTQGALGVHDRLVDGRPVIHVYRDLATQSGDAWQSIASHEALEVRGDPRLHACVELDNGEIWDREVCDRVEADSYPIDGVPMSNFNTPACFEPNTAQGAPAEKYDYLGLSTKPNEVRPDGYAQRFDMTTGWTQVGTMRAYRAALHAAGLTRAARRAGRLAPSIDITQDVAAYTAADAESTHRMHDEFVE